MKGIGIRSHKAWQRRLKSSSRGGLKTAAQLLASIVAVTMTFNMFIVHSDIQSVSTRTNQKVYKFFDAGRSYRDLNFSCPVPWEWTGNVTESDAVWFNVLDNGYLSSQIIAHQMTFKGYPQDSLKVFMSLESEVYYPYMVQAYKVFDYVVDYRIWGDIQKQNNHIPAVYLTNQERPDTMMDFRKPAKFPKRKDAYMAAFISNCGARNNRQRYLEELMEHMEIHSYGRCHHNKDEPESSTVSKYQRKLDIGGEYYFWFTAENSNAESYVTEKIYDALNAGVVPVYFGASNVQRFIPHPSAVIMADQYSPKELARLLTDIAEDPKEYEKYLAWKKQPYSGDFQRILHLASRTVQCRLAMRLEGLDIE